MSHHTSPEAVRYDVVIAGGGLVGASLACALAPLGLRIAVLEAVSPRSETQPSYDDRTLALNLASCRILEGIGLWSAVADSATPIRAVTVSELGRAGKACLRADETGLPWFGQVVEARAFGLAVQERLARLSGADWFCPASVTGLQAGADSVGFEATTTDGPLRGEARLAVLADGADSPLRAQLGIAAQTRDYAQTAVICNVTPEQSHAGRAFEILTPTGPMALLPHGGQRCGLVWCVSPATAERLLQLGEKEFLAEASARCGRPLGELRSLGRRSSYPLVQVLPERVCQGRVLLMGNAAHAIHPVGAQGFNLALRDVAALAELLADRIASGAGSVDAGESALLAAWAEWCGPDASATARWTDGLVGLYSGKDLLRQCLRRSALFLGAVSPTVRRHLAGLAMGYRPRVSRLALGEPLLLGGSRLP